MALGICESDPATPLKILMEPPQRSHFPALSAKEMPMFFNHAAEYDANPLTHLALMLLAFTFVRTSELINATWQEISIEDRVWNIPKVRMKERKPHYVPLSTQAIDCLEKLRSLTGNSIFLFPHRSDPTQPMSNSTILRLIDRIGYRGRMTGHGFRTLASTTLNESGLFSYDAIEKQLAHEESNAVRAAYNRAAYREERIAMMQWWGDFVYELIHASTNKRTSLFRQT